MNPKDYILPIYNHLQCGVGVCVENLFITAGHLFFENDAVAIVYINGKKFRLTSNDALFYQCNKPSKSYDVNFETDLAIFKIDEIRSPYILSEIGPNINDEIICYTYESKIEEVEKIKFINKKGFVSALHGNFLECFFIDKLHKGNSGSPIIKNNEILGILSGGLEGYESHKITFTSSQAIVNKLKNIGNK